MIVVSPKPFDLFGKDGRLTRLTDFSKRRFLCYAEAKQAERFLCYAATTCTITGTLLIPSRSEAGVAFLYRTQTDLRPPFCVLMSLCLHLSSLFVSFQSVDNTTRGWCSMGVVQKLNLSGLDIKESVGTRG